MFNRLPQEFPRCSRDAAQLWQGRCVKVVDGSSVSMPDTVANQALYPQPKGQKPGCGFPVMRIVAVFSLASGALLHLAKSALLVSERTLFHGLWEAAFQREDVVLADAGFCSYADLYLLGQRGVDCVMRNNQQRTKRAVQFKRLDKMDRLVHWHKPRTRPQWITPEQWSLITERMTVREIEVAVDIQGFRTRAMTLVTTLIDPRAFPKRSFVELYRRRWMAELFLRDIKITMRMDVLRCKTPEMIHKELYMHLIAYNLIRALMFDAANQHKRSTFQLSFKGACATVRAWTNILATPNLTAQKRQALQRNLYATIARDSLPNRPDRTQPRARKRRPKNYQLLTQPRSSFKETPHRNRYKKP